MTKWSFFLLSTSAPTATQRSHTHTHHHHPRPHPPSCESHDLDSLVSHSQRTVCIHHPYRMPSFLRSPSWLTRSNRVPLTSNRQVRMEYQSLVAEQKIMSEVKVNTLPGSPPPPLCCHSLLAFSCAIHCNISTSVTGLGGRQVGVEGRPLRGAGSTDAGRQHRLNLFPPPPPPPPPPNHNNSTNTTNTTNSTNFNTRPRADLETKGPSPSPRPGCPALAPPGRPSCSRLTGAGCTVCSGPGSHMVRAAAFCHVPIRHI